MRKLRVAVACLAILSSLGSAGAQVYPAHPLTMVVPFAAGGPNDAIARTLAARMQGSLGQPVMIENVDGAAGSIGTGRLARAAPMVTRSASAIGARMSPTARSTRSPTTC
jgi:tripartite-type tricarboxylate transporter receptor subunit TctC